MVYSEKYKLSSNHYHSIEYDKLQIVIGNSLSNDMKHINMWETIVNGESKNTTPFTISIDGTIHKHYEPKYYSDFINIGNVDRNIIGITLENEGCLWKDDEKKCYVNWVGDIYKRKAKVIEVKWRDREYWSPYSLKQVNSLVKLCKELCLEFNIPLESLETNTITPSMEDFNGISFRSNFSKYYFDVTPAFDIKTFKDKIEKK